MFHYVILCYIMLYYVLLCYIMYYYALLCYIIMINQNRQYVSDNWTRKRDGTGGEVRRGERRGGEGRGVEGREDGHVVM